MGEDNRLRGRTVTEVHFFWKGERTEKTRLDRGERYQNRKRKGSLTGSSGWNKFPGKNGGQPGNRNADTIFNQWRKTKGKQKQERKRGGGAQPREVISTLIGKSKVGVP